MLSALAKYIFGGVMGDAPETTPMQYETREMNDWLLVDMPDQAIDDEDMDSESDDEDDILSAVPLLMDEETLAYPQQIVLSHEANSVCDNTYGRARKDFRDKKVQVHSGDKIQGNFLKNIETLSVETEDKSQVKAPTNSTKLQENSKSKRSKSKKSKATKRFRKSKIQNSKDAKIKDIQTAAKETTDNVQENSQKDFQEIIQSVTKEIPDSSVNNKANNVSKIENFVVPMQENSTNVFQNANVKFHDNKVQDHFDKTQQEMDNKVQSDFSLTKNSSSKSTILSTTEDIQEQNVLHCNDRIQKPSDNHVIFEGNTQELKGNASKSKKLRSKPKRFRKNKIQNSTDVKVKAMLPAAKENTDNIQENSNDVQKDFCQTIQLVKCEIADSSVNNNKISKARKSEELPVPVPENSTDVIQGVDEKIHDEKVQEHFDKTQQDIHNEVQSYFSEIKDSSNETKIMAEGGNAEISNCIDLPTTDDAQVQNHQKSSDELVNCKRNIQGIYLEPKGNSSKSKKLRSKKSRKSRTQHKFYRKTQSTIEVAQGAVQENINDADNNIKVIPPKVVSKLDDESNGKHNHEDMDVCVTDDENTEAFLKDIMENLYECQENIDKKMLFTTSEVQCDACDVTKDTFLDEENVSENSNDQLQYNVHDLETKDIGTLENNNNEFSEKSVEDKSNDSDLEGFSDFWDIYTKFQEDSDDEVIEISDEEMDENFSVEMQASDDEMDESSDKESYSATDDDLSEGSDFNSLKLSITERKLLHAANMGDFVYIGNYTGDVRWLKKIDAILVEGSDEESEYIEHDLMLTARPDLLIRYYNKRFNLRQKQTPRYFRAYQENPLRRPKTSFEPPKFQAFTASQVKPSQSFSCESKRSFASQLAYRSTLEMAFTHVKAQLDGNYKDSPQGSFSTSTTQKNQKRMTTKKQASNNDTTDSSVVINTTELQNFINQLKPTVSVLPTKSAVVLEHVKELKPVQQAIQFEARKYLTRTQLNRQNRNYIYQSSVKTNRRRDLQRNHSGANNNRKCY